MANIQALTNKVRGYFSFSGSYGELHTIKCAYTGKPVHTIHTTTTSRPGSGSAHSALAAGYINAGQVLAPHWQGKKALLRNTTAPVGMLNISLHTNRLSTHTNYYNVGVLGVDRLKVSVDAPIVTYNGAPYLTVHNIPILNDDVHWAQDTYYQYGEGRLKTTIVELMWRDKYKDSLGVDGTVKSITDFHDIGEGYYGNVEDATRALKRYLNNRQGVGTLNYLPIAQVTNGLFVAPAI